MNFDLATALVVLIVVSVLIIAYEKRFLPKLPEEQEPYFFPDLARSLLPIFIIVLVLRSFLAEPFRIPSGSMMPTLLVGDFILVNKFAYGLRLPVLNTKLIEVGEPERGDVVVFRYPVDPRIPYIKRVVGVPGDELAYDHVNKTLYLNGKLVAQEKQNSYIGVGAGSNMTGADYRIETLPNGIKHDVLVRPEFGGLIPYIWEDTKMTVEKLDVNALRMMGQNLPFDLQNKMRRLQITKIPEGHYFVLGDNRDNSRDSRFWGLVPEENLVGKAFFVWMNWEWASGGIHWQRIGAIH